MTLADKVWTSAEALAWTVSRFTGAAIEQPRLDAELLLAEALGCDRVDLYANPDRSLGVEERARYRGLIQRRLDGEPVAYILERKAFRYLTLAVSPAVLIPRPETELLVEAVLAFAAGDRGGLVAADIGTGSGAVAVSVAREIDGARVYATDVSEEALGLASENAKAAGVSDRIDFLQGDLLEPLASGIARVPDIAEAPGIAGTLDVVVSNPPYIPTAEIDALPAEISRYEPRGALDGGADGLSVLRRIIDAAPDFLRPGGLLALEIGEAQADAVSTMMKDRFDQITVLRDLAGLDRVVTGVVARP